MTVHDHTTLPEGALVYAQLLTPRGDDYFSCSICAPFQMTKEEVEAFAENELGYPLGGWEAVDKSRIQGLGAATPRPCNQAAERQHWFLLSGYAANRLGFETQK